MALQHALDAIDRQRDKVDEIWCLGDLIGTPAPNETVALAVDACDVVVAGNHDLVGIGRLHEVYVATHGGPTMLALRDELSPATCRALADLPIFVTRLDCAATHACVDHPVARMLEGYEAEAQLALVADRFLVVGHSHVPFFYDDAERQWIEDATDTRQIFRGRAVICPGSVLDVDHAPASYCLLDTDEGACSWHRVA